MVGDPQSGGGGGPLGWVDGKQAVWIDAFDDRVPGAAGSAVALREV